MIVRSIVRPAILIAMSVVGVLLVLAVAYGVRGSLEWFPTAEQQGAVRWVTTLLAVGLAVAEVGLWLLLRWVNQAAGSKGGPALSGHSGSSVSGAE